MSDTKIFVSVRDRVSYTKNCIRSLVGTSRNKADIIIFDNNSQEDFFDLIEQYAKWQANGKVSQVIMNRSDIMPNVYWSKNYAWAQMLLLCKLLPEHECKYIVMVDNDVAALPGWLEACRGILESPVAKKKDICVASPYDGFPRYDNRGDITEDFCGENINCGGYSCRMRSRQVSRFWMAKYSWWKSLDPPSYKKIIRFGKPDRMPTDWYYWEKLKTFNGKIAILSDPLAMDVPGLSRSARMDNNIGADCK